MNTNDGKSKKIYSVLNNTNLPPGIIKLNIKGQDEGVVSFKMNVDTKLDGVMKRYGEKQQVDYRTIRFLYNGNLVHGRETPRELGVEDGDTIDAMMEADGGGPPIPRTA